MSTMYITTQGASLSAKTLQGTTLSFSRFAVGSGTVDEDNIKELTDLVNEVSSFNVTKVTEDTDTQVTARGLFNSSNITEDFYLKELGLYAINNETNEEVLFAYINYGDEAEYISTDDIRDIYYELIIAIDNADNVEVTTDTSSVYVTEKELDTATTINQSTIELTETITAGTEYTTPINYKVGNNSLEIYYNGEKLIEGTHYNEVGSSGDTSNIITFISDLEYIDMSDIEEFEDFTSILEFIVRGDYS